MTNFTSEQLAFIDAVRQGDKPLSLRAVAGAGKTTVLVAAVNAYADDHPFADVTCVAFNKKNADELAQRMPGQVNSKTMNAVGHRAWAGRMNGRKLEVSNNKTYGSIRQLHGRDYRLPEGLEDVPKLVALAKLNGMVPQSRFHLCEFNIAPDEDFIWDDLIDHFDLMIDEEKRTKAIMLARELLEHSIDQAFEGQLDFNDQLYMPVCFGGSWTKSDLVLIDEAQDISQIQREMLRRMLKSSGKLIAVGDPRQAIYGFRGAASDSMHRIAEEFGQFEMALTYTFRCSQKVTELAQGVVPDIKCPDTAPVGSVAHVTTWKLADIPSDAAILCRNTKPLVDLAFRLIHRRIPCFVLGRDIGANLIRLIKSMKADDVLDLVEKLRDWQDFAVAKAVRQGKEERAESIRDRVETVMVCIDTLEPDQTEIADLIRVIEGLFTEMKGGICLTTIHKAKGAEWDMVYFLNRNLIPSRYATQDWQLEQEDNLYYVGVTRAHVDLRFVQGEGAV